MGQAPGTHWYHAHKHGSTALNLANGMAGALIIEGDYDATLKTYYQDKAATLKEQVLVLQQYLRSAWTTTRGGKVRPGFREWELPAGFGDETERDADVADC